MVTTKLVWVLFILDMLIALSRALDPCSADEIYVTTTNGTRTLGMKVHWRDCDAKVPKKFRKLYKVSGFPAIPPTIMDVTSFCQPDANDTNQMKQSGINVEWTLPEFSGVEMIKGFDLMLDSDKLRDERCILITLTDNITVAMIRESKPSFRACLYPISGEAGSVKVTVNSLPNSLSRIKSSAANQTRTIEPKRCSPPSSSEWCPSHASSIYDAFNKTLKISFDPAPALFNISQYKIYERVLDQTTSVINQTEHAYSDVEPGNYTFEISLYASNERDNCACRNNMGRCDTCTICIYNYIAEVTTVAAAITTTTDIHNTSEAMTLSVSFASVMLVLLCINAVLFRRRLRKYIGCSEFQLKQKPEFHRRIFVFVQTDSNMSNTQKAKDLLESQLGVVCEYYNAYLDDKVKDTITTILNGSNVSRQSTDTPEGSQANVNGVVCVCLVLGDREPMDNINRFQETLITLQCTQTTNAMTRGLIIHWDSPPRIPVSTKRLILCYKLPDEHTQLLAETSSFMTTSCQKYVPKSESLDNGINNTTSVTIPQYAEYKGMTVDINKKKGRYPSNDSALGESLPTPSYLQDLQVSDDCFERDSMYLDQEEFDFGQTYDRNIGHLYNRNTSSDRDMGNSYACHREHAPLCRQCAPGREYVDNPQVYEQSRQQTYMNYETDGDMDFVPSKSECNISFIPPTPSLLSIEIHHSEVTNPESQVKSAEWQAHYNGESGGDNPMKKSNSIDNLMNEFSKLNNRNRTLNIGEVYSVFEGCA